jgi:RNA polymerase sigma-32 factor
MPRRVDHDPLGAQALAPVSREEERALFARYHAGDASAGDTLIRVNLKLVMREARSRARGSITVAELVAEGAAGLGEALPNFDPARGLRFTTFGMHLALRRMRGLLAAAASDSFGGCARDRAALRPRLRREASRLATVADRPEAVAALAVELRMSPERLEQLLALAAHREARLDAPVDHGEDDRTLLDSVSGEAPDPEAVALAGELRGRRAAAVARALGGLTPREREVVERRAMVDSDERATFTELGAQWGLTRQRIEQIERRALAKLARRLAAWRDGGDGTE